MLFRNRRLAAVLGTALAVSATFVSADRRFLLTDVTAARPEVAALRDSEGTATTRATYASVGATYLAFEDAGLHLAASVDVGKLRVKQQRRESENSRRARAGWIGDPIRRLEVSAGRTLASGTTPYAGVGHYKNSHDRHQGYGDSHYTANAGLWHELRENTRLRIGGTVQLGGVDRGMGRSWDAGVGALQTHDRLALAGKVHYVDAGHDHGLGVELSVGMAF